RPGWANSILGEERPPQLVDGPRRQPLLNPKVAPPPMPGQPQPQSMMVPPPPPPRFAPPPPVDYYGEASNPSSAWKEPENAPVRKSFSGITREDAPPPPPPSSAVQVPTPPPVAASPVNQESVKAAPVA